MNKKKIINIQLTDWINNKTLVDAENLGRSNGALKVHNAEIEKLSSAVVTVDSKVDVTNTEVTKVKNDINTINTELATKGSKQEIETLKTNKIDDVIINGNNLKFFANGTEKKNIVIPSSSGGSGNVDLSNYYTKNEVDTKDTTIKESVSAVDAKAIANTNKISEVTTQLENVKTNLPTDLKLTGNKLQLKKSDGTVVGIGIDLPVGDGSGGSVDLSAYQTKDDNSIIGIDKTIVGSINNNYNKIQSLDNQINVRKLVNLKTTNIKNAETYLNIPTYDGLDQIVHTKVLYFKDGWNGYKFWMGHTPLPYIPQVDESKENPCIMVSNDGENWITPSGLTNPLDTPQAVKCQYLSDTHLVFKDNKLELWYRAFNPEIIYKKVSSDGINWGERIEILRGNGEEIVCPTVVFDENKYKLWVVKKVESPSIKYILDYMESNDGINFSHIRDIELSNTNIGHHDIIKTEYGYECIFHERGDQRVYYTRSADNITWDTCIEKFTVIPNSWQNNKLYRPNLTVVDGDYYLYYTGGLSTQGAKIGLIKINGEPTPKIKLPATNIIQDDEHIFISKRKYDSILNRLTTIESKLNIEPPLTDVFASGDIFTFKTGIKLTTSEWKDTKENGVTMNLHNIADINDGVVLNGSNSYAEITNCTFRNNVSYTVSIKYKYNTNPISKGKVLFFSNILTSAQPRCIRIEEAGFLAYDGTVAVIDKKILSPNDTTTYVVDFVYQHNEGAHNSIYTIYVNGQSIGTGRCTSRDANFNHMLLGRQVDGVNQYGSATIYYLTAYSKALTPSEIIEKYNRGI